MKNKKKLFRRSYQKAEKYLNSAILFLDKAGEERAMNQDELKDRLKKAVIQIQRVKKRLFKRKLERLRKKLKDFKYGEVLDR